MPKTCENCHFANLPGDIYPCSSCNAPKFPNWQPVKIVHDSTIIPSAAPTHKIQIGGTHYQDMQIQPWDVVDTWPLQQQVGFYRGSALKYLMRIGTKDTAIQEAKKALHNLEKLIETLEKE